METRKLDIPSGYNPTNQHIVGLFAAQLDLQLARLKKDLEGLSVAQLEWQLKPGMNTIGMLLAHLAIVEVFWINQITHQVPKEEWDSRLEPVIGLKGDDDGMPIPQDGTHPAVLKNKTLVDYFGILDKARKAVHGELQSWSDADLERVSTMPERAFGHSWIVYHVLEHFAAHYGQILMIKHLMRDAGVLEKK